MAIKAIINNTEKEIEQIKNSDEQDIDYVYSRIGDTEVEGELPISIKSIGGNLADYRIYGNTVDGESVGDRTGNLFDMSSVYAIGYIDDNGNIAVGQFGYDITTYDFIPIVQNSSYSIKICGKLNDNPGWRKIRVAFYDQKQKFISRTILGNVVGGESFIAINNSHFIRLSIDDGNTNIMLNEGSTPLPYEPYGYKVPVTVEGKNLVPNTATSQTINGVTFTVNNDGSVTCNGTSTSQYYSLFRIPCYLVAGNYTISGCPVGGGSRKYRADIRISPNGGMVGGDADTGAGVTIPIDESGWYDYTIRIQGGYAVDDVTFKPMIRKADIEDDTYEPYRTPVTTPIYLPEQIRKVGDEAEYIDYGEQKQRRVRKNLLLNTAASQTIDGVTFTVNSDGSVTCNGTATSTIVFLIFEKELSQNIYILSGCPENGAQNERYKMQMNPGARWYADIGNGLEFEIQNTSTIKVRIVIYPSYTCDNLTFYPMIRKADIEDDTYEPYITNTELDVTLPALSTIKGTNTFSVNTSIQPSNIYVKDNFDYKKVFTATRTIEGESPLNYRSIEDSDSTLSNYRIYGQTSRNLLQNTATSQTINGVAFTVNSDGSVTCNGTANNTTVFIIHNFPRFSGECILSGCPMNGSQDTYRLQYTNARDMSYKDYGTGCNIYQFDETQYPLSVISIRIENGYTCDNLTFYPMIRKADIEDVPYEPYGESVGDRTGNLFDGIFLQGCWLGRDGSFQASSKWICTQKMPCKANTDYTFTFGIKSRWYGFAWYDIDGNYIESNGSTIERQPNIFTAISPANAAFMAVNIAGDHIGTAPLDIHPSDVTDFMLVEGSTPLPYEPYGYKVPVTVSNGTDTLTTPIYLPEQIKKVGDEAEYIDYGEQKQHRVRKNLWSGIVEQGSVSTIGNYANALDRIRSKNISLSPGTYTISCNLGIRCIFAYNNREKVSCVVDNVAMAIYSNTFTVPIGANNVSVGLRAFDASGAAMDNVKPSDFKWGQIEKGSKATTYEPYIEDTDLDVTLPALPTLSGTNTLTVGTEVQPSDIYLKGKIKKKPKIYYKIYYYSQDGQTALSTETVEEGHDCTYSTVPTKESDTDFDYIFTGWSTSTNSTTATAGATENIQQNTNLYAAFSKSFKTDTISDSWEEIIANCDNGTYASKYQIGDLKTIDVGTEGPVQMQIVAIDTDLLASDNTKKAPITWISKQLLNTYKAMHSTSSNYLSDWTNCDMRTYLRGTILPMLPSVVQNGIKEVTKYTCKRTSSTTYTTVSTTENIWLPSYREVSYYTTNCETSGVQYNSIFTNDYASQRIKLRVGEAEDDAYYWWTRSASGDSLNVHQFYFALVGRGGYTNYIGWDCTSFGGVAIGFCT